MATGEPQGASDPFEDRIDFEESLEEVTEEEPGPVARLVDLLKRPFR